jgi:hypothetical protein
MTKKLLFFFINELFGGILTTFFHVTVGNVTRRNDIGNRTEIVIHIFRLFEYKTRILEMVFFRD